MRASAFYLMAAAATVSQIRDDLKTGKWCCFDELDCEACSHLVCSLVEKYPHLVNTESR